METRSRMLMVIISALMVPPIDGCSAEVVSGLSADDAGVIALCLEGRSSPRSAAMADRVRHGVALGPMELGTVEDCLREMSDPRAAAVLARLDDLRTQWNSRNPR